MSLVVVVWSSLKEDTIASHMNNHVPGAVHSGNGVSIVTSMLQELQEVISGDDTRRYDITKGSHGGR